MVVQPNVQPNVSRIGRRLIRQSDLRCFMVDAYYACHEADPVFREALAVLVAEVARHLPDRRHRIPLEADDPDDPAGSAAAQAVHHFARRWALPARDGTGDVRFTVHAARGHPRAVLRLSQGVRAEWTGFPAGPDALTDVDGNPMLVPPYAMALAIDLRRMSWAAAEARVDAEVERIRRDLRGQLRAQERVLLRAGWCLLPSGYDSRATLRRLAMRLYRRAVSRLAFADIAEDEHLQHGVDVTDQAIRESVAHWATELGVPLPPERIRSRRRRP
jgi:hypothetical protein